MEQLSRQMEACAGVTSIGSETATNTTTLKARATFLAISSRGLLNELLTT
jgi:hypothetical protein